MEGERDGVMDRWRERGREGEKGWREGESSGGMERQRE